MKYPILMGASIVKSGNMYKRYFIVTAIAIMLSTVTCYAAHPILKAEGVQKFKLGFSYDKIAASSWVASGSAAAGIIVAYDAFEHKMNVYNLAGKKLCKFGETGMLPGQFIEPTGISIDDKGNIYIADQRIPRIRVYNSKGQMVRELTPSNGVIGWHDIAVINSIIVVTPDVYSAMNNNAGVYVMENNTVRRMCTKCTGKVAIEGDSGNVVMLRQYKVNDTAMSVMSLWGRQLGRYNYDDNWIRSDIATYKQWIFVTNSGQKLVEIYDLKAQYQGVLYDGKVTGQIPIATIPINDKVYIVHHSGDVYIYSIKIDN